MPLIELKIMENTFSGEQIRDAIARLTDAMVAIKGEAIRPMVWVKIYEVKDGNWGVGGKPFTRADAAALIRGQAK